MFVTSTLSPVNSQLITQEIIGAVTNSSKEQSPLFFLFLDSYLFNSLIWMVLAPN